ncbi:hypothetical protein ACRALDRAFT_210577 [Sodiomyces alcalophilus JCM 7366]|uniref:uncharacterized protein n=1 Tax=Sodiomyces alcalophilus JCM 7366 TaxID=591952 RepID=UPI0039B47F24
MLLEILRWKLFWQCPNPPQTRVGSSNTHSTLASISYSTAKYMSGPWRTNNVGNAPRSLDWAYPIYRFLVYGDIGELAIITSYTEGLDSPIQ